jgi:RNA polymerase sigma factor (TIGR02999 family)
MDSPGTGEITQLLRAAQEGDRMAFDEVYRIVYEELRGLARAIRSRNSSPTLNTTALVHESYLKLVPGPSGGVHDRAHFFAIAARAMRQVLVDAARRRSADKRGGGVEVVQLDESADVVAESGKAASIPADEILALNEALQQLQEWNPRQASVVECRVFAGLSVPETALALNISEPTVKRDWQTARAWLAHALGHS